MDLIPTGLNSAVLGQAMEKYLNKNTHVLYGANGKPPISTYNTNFKCFCLLTSLLL